MLDEIREGARISSLPLNNIATSWECRVEESASASNQAICGRRADAARGKTAIDHDGGLQTSVPLLWDNMWLAGRVRTRSLSSTRSL